MNSSTIIAVVAAVAAPLGAYLVAARRFSGKIETSDAKQLWHESRSIREWSVKRIAELNGVIRTLEGRVASLEAHNGDLVAVNNRLAKELEECRQLRTP
jgi:chromosome segregation ATPase